MSYRHMYKRGIYELAVWLAFLLGAVPALASPKNGYFVSHQEAVERGGVGNYAPTHYKGPHYRFKYRNQEPGTLPPSLKESGRFLSHDQIVAMGGVGNYLTRAQAKAYERNEANLGPRLGNG